MHANGMGCGASSRQEALKMTMLVILGRIHNHLAVHHGVPMSVDVLDIKRCAVIGLSRDLCNASISEMCALTCETPESVMMFMNAWANVGEKTRGYWRRVVEIPYH